MQDVYEKTEQYEQEQVAYERHKDTFVALVLTVPFVLFVAFLMLSATSNGNILSPQDGNETNWGVLGLVATGLIAFFGVSWFIVKNADKISLQISSIRAFLKSLLPGKTARRKKKKRVTKNQNLERWNVLREWYASTLAKITQYETDIHFAIKYPAMNDPLEPATAAMLEALEQAEYAMKPIPAEGIGGDNEIYAMVSEKVSALSSKIAQAEANAKKVALNNVSEDDRRDFRQAEMLLQHVTNNGNPPKTRANYAEKLKQVIQRINERNSLHLVPDNIIAEIELHHRRALAAPAESAEAADEGALPASDNTTSHEAVSDAEYIDERDQEEYAAA